MYSTLTVFLLKIHLTTEKKIWLNHDYGDIDNIQPFSNQFAEFSILLLMGMKVHFCL